MTPLASPRATMRPSAWMMGELRLETTFDFFSTLAFCRFSVARRLMKVRSRTKELKVNSTKVFSAFSGSMLSSSSVSSAARALR